MIQQSGYSVNAVLVQSDINGSPAGVPNISNYSNNNCCVLFIESHLKRMCMAG